MVPPAMEATGSQQGKRAGGLCSPSASRHAAQLNFLPETPGEASGRHPPGSPPGRDAAAEGAMRTRAELWGGRRRTHGRDAGGREPARGSTGRHPGDPSQAPWSGRVRQPRLGPPVQRCRVPAAETTAWGSFWPFGQAARARSWQEPHGRLFLPDRELPAQQRHSAQGGLRPPGECVVSPEPVAPGSPRAPAPGGRPKSRAPPPPRAAPQGLTPMRKAISVTVRPRTHRGQRPHSHRSECVVPVWKNPLRLSSNSLQFFSKPVLKHEPPKTSMSPLSLFRGWSSPPGAPQRPTPRACLAVG